MKKILPLRRQLIPALLFITTYAFSQNVVTVTNCNMNGWVKQVPAGTSLAFQNEPVNPLLGKGSLELSASQALKIVRFRNVNYNGVRLSSLTELSWSSYISSRANSYDAPFVVITVDLNDDGATDDFLEFGPQYQGHWAAGIAPDQGEVATGIWQTWDMLHGAYWLGPTTDPEHGGALFTLATYISQHPTAKIVNDPATGGGGFRLSGGGGFYPDMNSTTFNFECYTDNVRIGVNGSTTVYDFEFTTANAGDDKDVIYGYGANCTMLNGAAAGGVAPYTYSWSGGATPANASNKVCPTSNSTYTLTVTDANGCTGTDDVLVNVTDVRCGSSMAKVKICHNGKEICVAKEAVPAHLRHGDVLGSCPQELKKGITDTGDKEMAELPSQYRLSNYPNPLTGSTRIVYELPTEGYVSLKVYTLSGKEIATLVNGNKKQGKYFVDFVPSGLSTGIYYYTIVVSSATKAFLKTNKMMIIHE
jgi:hypothetical protein